VAKGEESQSHTGSTCCIVLTITKDKAFGDALMEILIRDGVEITASAAFYLPLYEPDMLRIWLLMPASVLAARPRPLTARFFSAVATAMPVPMAALAV